MKINRRDGTRNNPTRGAKQMRTFTRFPGRLAGKLFPLMLWSALGLVLPWNPLQAAVYRTLPAGGTGGTPFSINCDGFEKVLAGIEGKSSALVDHIGPLCVSVDGTGRWIGQPSGFIQNFLMGSDGKYVTRTFGGSGGSPFHLQCPANTAVSGIQGKAGNLVDQLRIFCGPMGANGSLQSVGSLLPRQAGGGGGNAFGPHYCIENKPGIGISGRAGSFVDQISLVCGHVTPVPPPRLTRFSFSSSETARRIRTGESEIIGVDLAPAASLGEIGISLRSSNPLVAAVPSILNFKGWGGTVGVLGKGAGCTRIEASYLGDKYSVDLLVDGPSSPTASIAFSTDPSADPWPLGRAVVATLTVPAAAPAGGLSFVVGSSHPQVVPVPNSVLIPAGSRTTSFDIVPRNSSLLGDCIVVTATGNGAVVKRVGVVTLTPVQPVRPKIPAPLPPVNLQSPRL
jgi:hypothetical protein